MLDINVKKFATVLLTSASMLASQHAFAADTNDAADMGTEEIIVTAQKRSERLQDVPISISAFNNEQLKVRGIRTSFELTQSTPGLNISNNFGNVITYIRGVGSALVVPGEIGSVATYIDGVYIPSNIRGSYDLRNVESVQVLKGPQGTLFGRNTAGGAIVISTGEPEFTFKGKADIGYGNYDAFSSHLNLTGPLSDNVAVLFQGAFSDSQGYFKDIVNNKKKVGDERIYAFRGKIAVNASERLKFTLGADYMRNNNDGQLAKPFDGYLGVTNALPIPQGTYEIAQDVDAYAKVIQYGGLLRSEYDASAFNIISITGFRKAKFRTLYDSDATPIRYSVINSDERSQSFSQELQLVSQKTGSLEWIAGAFYSNSIAGYYPILINATRIDARVRSRTVGIFLDGTYKFGDFKLTGGLRYNQDRIRYRGTLNGTPRVTGAKAKWTAWTPRIVLSYNPDPTLLLYGSFSKGFKAGLFNQTAFLTTPINPEKIDAYEVGVKLQPSRIFTINAAAFYYDISDLQVNTQDTVLNLQRLANAASARSKGFEVDATVRPFDNFHFSVGVSYLDATYHRFPEAQGFVPNTPVAPTFLPNSGGLSSISRDVSGNRQQRTPEWTYNLAASYTLDLASGGSIVPSANVYYQSSVFFDAFNTLRQKGYELVNAQISWNLPGDNVSLVAWGQNLTNSSYIVSTSPSTFADRRYYGSPRTYGVRAEFKF